MVVLPPVSCKAPIRVVAAVIRDSWGRLLLVRKQGTQSFQQPGGKPDPEDIDELATLARELAEETGATMHRNGAVWLGELGAPAAHEPGRLVEASVYSVCADGPFTAGAEIAELRWIELDAADNLPLAPLTRDGILPLLRERGHWSGQAPDGPIPSSRRKDC